MPVGGRITTIGSDAPTGFGSIISPRPVATDAPSTKNIGTWMPIGAAIGLSLGLMLGHKKQDDGKDDTHGEP